MKNNEVFKDELLYLEGMVILMMIGSAHAEQMYLKQNSSMPRKDNVYLTHSVPVSCPSYPLPINPEVRVENQPDLTKKKSFSKIEKPLKVKGNIALSQMSLSPRQLCFTEKKNSRLVRNVPVQRTSNPKSVRIASYDRNAKRVKLQREI